ncbi:MAG: MgtC/SapB family protein [Chloroflexi bacterium]|nr:MgtC/SapB family protein [Chloroflexota bacterium]
MIPWWEVLLRLVLAMLLGGIIGWEREAAGKPAGFRTMILVSLSAAMYIVAAQLAAEQFGESHDSVRGMTGIVQGISFLGAGIILRSQGEVRWLTTAAAVWASAAIGTATGLGIYLVAVAGSVLIYITLHWLPHLEQRLQRSRKTKTPPKSSNSGDNRDY